ncbi:CarD family transcriptional regulator [Alphaproteobacteria bacterium]|nr:CarD family transcriptional regulator [Alphaproteobacteria bacterium]
MAQTSAQPKLFQPGDKVVYPSHGVGSVESLEAHEIAGETLNVYVISFEQERMKLRLPVTKANSSGLRGLSSKRQMAEALKTLKTKGKVKRTMWARRAQEYELKINSGNPESIAEVLRDLHRNTSQPEQSYSERQLYQAALERLSREVCAVEIVSEAKAVETIKTALQIDG